MLFPQTTSMFW